MRHAWAAESSSLLSGGNCGMAKAVAVMGTAAKNVTFSSGMQGLGVAKVAEPPPE